MPVTISVYMSVVSSVAGTAGVAAGAVAGAAAGLAAGVAAGAFAHYVYVKCRHVAHTDSPVQQSLLTSNAPETSGGPTETFNSVNCTTLSPPPYTPECTLDPPPAYQP